MPDSGLGHPGIEFKILDADRRDSVTVIGVLRIDQNVVLLGDDGAWQHQGQ